MSSRSDRHEGVSCDACMKNNFGGRRYKCLVCFDFDLCAECYDSGQSSTEQHNTDHPVQCILTRDDFDFYYGNESVSPDQPQALACPFCRSLGFTETDLHQHLTAEHADASEFSFDVVCPVCAATPNGEPNRMVSDLIGHLAIEHMGNRREASEEQSSGPRRLARGRQTTIRGRGTSRLLMEAVSSRGGHANNGIAAVRDSSASSDPITELLNQLGGMRRPGNPYSSTLAQIQQIQQQLGRGGNQSGSRRAVVATLPRETGSSRDRTYADALWEELASSARQNTTTAQAEGAVPGPSLAVAGTVPSGESPLLLLPKLLQENAQKEQEAANAVRMQRSKLVEDLLMATLDEDFSAINLDQDSCALARPTDSEDYRKNSQPAKEVQVDIPISQGITTPNPVTENSGTQTPQGLLDSGAGGETHRQTNGPRIRKVIINCAYDQ